MDFSISQDLAGERQHLLLNKLKLSLEMKDESAKAWGIPTSQLAKCREGRGQESGGKYFPGQVPVDPAGESAASSFLPPPPSPKCYLSDITVSTIE